MPYFNNAKRNLISWGCHLGKLTSKFRRTDAFASAFGACSRDLSASDWDFQATLWSALPRPPTGKSEHFPHLLLDTAVGPLTSAYFPKRRRCEKISERHELVPGVLDSFTRSEG
jgi:hypothetical protein